MRQYVTMLSAILIVDGGLILTTGHSIAGERAPDRLFNGSGLILLGLGVFALYEAVRWARRHRTKPMSAEEAKEFHMGGGL